MTVQNRDVADQRECYGWFGSLPAEVSITGDRVGTIEDYELD